MEDRLRRVAKSIDPAVLGPRIRAARLAVGKTQGQVADGRASAAYLSRIEAGQRRPDPDLLEHLAARVGASVEALLTGASADRRDFLRLEVDYAELSLASGAAREALDRVSAVAAEIADYDLPEWGTPPGWWWPGPTRRWGRCRRRSGPTVRSRPLAGF